MAPVPPKIQTRLPRGGCPVRSCLDDILLGRRGQHQMRLESGGCPGRSLASDVSGGGTHCSNSVHWGGASRGVGGVSPGSSVLGEHVPSFGADAGPFERFEQRSTVDEFVSAGWLFGSAPGRGEFAGWGGGVGMRAMWPAHRSLRRPEDAGLDGVDSASAGVVALVIW